MDTAANALPTSSWTHVACSFDGTVLRIYVNGAVAAFESGSGSVTTAGTNGLAIGSNSPSGDNFAGLIDDLRIWRIARTAAQICAASGC